MLNYILKQDLALYVGRSVVYVHAEYVDIGFILACGEESSR